MPLSTFIITFALNEQRGALRCGLRSYPTNLMRLVPPKGLLWNYFYSPF